jgi:hypothetical protein
MIKVFVSMIIFFSAMEVFAHSGRTNSSGCHNDHKNGGYHCHRSNTKIHKNTSNSKIIKHKKIASK